MKTYTNLEIIDMQLGQIEDNQHCYANDLHFTGDKLTAIYSLLEELKLFDLQNPELELVEAAMTLLKMSKKSIESLEKITLDESCCIGNLNCVKKICEVIERMPVGNSSQTIPTPADTTSSIR